MKKYIFKRYEKNYPILFNRERKKLEKILGKKIKIEHIGSTSIKGLGGKGIIDIFIGAKKNNLKIIKDKLIENNYLLISTAGGKNRLFFERDYKNKGKIRRVHLHLTTYKSRVWNDTIKIRDLLRKNKKFAKEYSKIKIKAVKFAKGDGEKYKRYKRKFLDELIK